MDRRVFVRACALGSLSVALGANAQRSGTLPRIGLLSPGPSPAEDGFFQGMRDLGYYDGKNIVVDRRSAEGDFARLPALAAELVRSKPTLIVAMLSAAALAAKEATSTIPIVAVSVSDPVAVGLVGNLAHPGGNVTGTSSQGAAIVGKQIELVHELVPRTTRLAILWNPANAIYQQLILSEALRVAARLHVLARLVETRTDDELERAFATLDAEQPDAAVLILVDPFFISRSARLAELALAHRKPLFSGSRELVEAGALAVYGTDYGAAGRRSAAYVQKILKGAKPGDLAVELPTKFELEINLRTAKALGIDIPGAVLARADEVIR